MVLGIFKHALMISSFVFIMMLLIEYINVQTSGSWQESLKKSRWGQYIFGSLLGALPGCLGAWVQNNMLMMLAIAVLVGIIPESGPHLIFMTMFASGTLPFAILLASSIVQDGHGMLPMLAVSRRGFIIVKLVNIVIGLLVGIAGLYVF